LAVNLLKIDNDQAKEVSLDPIFQKRVDKVRASLAKNQLDALMVSIQENRYYLSGFTGEDTQFDESAGFLIISEKHQILATDSRYELQAKEQAGGYEVFCYKKSLEKELPKIIKARGIRRLGFEGNRISHKNYSLYTQAFRKLAAPVEMISTENIVETLRRVKSEAEIQRTVNALQLAEKAFFQVLGRIRPGLTEKEVAWEMEKTMREAGAQSLSFPVIVASGPNSALPHAIPTDRKLQPGEPVLIDWGARLAEYCSDTTRTIILGKPDEKFMHVYETVVTARDTAASSIKAGASGTAVDKVARDIIEKNGFAGKFGHSLGHGTGLAVHEGPRLSPLKDDHLETGMIVTVEPGIYLPGWGGIRMENQVVVRSDRAQVLNNPKPFDPLIHV
jgi:Xaa-Pro aminopeptidase